MKPKPPNPNATVEIKLSDLDSVDLGPTPEATEDEAPQRRSRATPPPLPPSASMPAAAPLPSFAPAPSIAPPPRSPLFFVVVIVAVIGVGLALGAVVTRSTRAPARPAPSAQPPATSAQPPATITIPTVDIDDSDAAP